MYVKLLHSTQLIDKYLLYLATSSHSNMTVNKRQLQKVRPLRDKHKNSHTLQRNKLPNSVISSRQRAHQKRTVQNCKSLKTTALHLTYNCTQNILAVVQTSANYPILFSLLYSYIGQKKTPGYRDNNKTMRVQHLSKRGARVLKLSSWFRQRCVIPTEYLSPQFHGGAPSSGSGSFVDSEGSGLTFITLCYG